MASRFVIGFKGIGCISSVLRRLKVRCSIFDNIGSRPASIVVSTNLGRCTSRTYSFLVTINNNSPVSTVGTVNTITAGNKRVSSCCKGVVRVPAPPVITIPAADNANSRTARFAVVAGAGTSVGVLLGNPILVPRLTVSSPGFALATPTSMATTAKLSTLYRTARTCASEGTRPLASSLTVDTAGQVFGGLPVICSRPSGVGTQRRVDLTTLRTNITFGGTSMAVVRNVDHPVNTLFRIPRNVSGTVLVNRYCGFTVSNTCSHFTRLNETINTTSTRDNSGRTTRTFLSNYLGLYRVYGVPALRNFKVSHSGFFTSVSGVTSSTLTSNSPTGAVGPISGGSVLRVCGGL